MAELTTTASAYATGSIDTWSNRTNDPGGDEIRAEHVNGLGSAIVQIETVLGDGTALKGSKTDLATRLAVQMTSTGIIVPIGAVNMFAGAVAPTGWLLCDQDVSRTTYSDLFAVVGTSYGTGDGSTTFGLPRFAGRVPVGVGTGTGGASSGTGNPTGGSALTAVARGTWKGEETHTLTAAEIQHTNSISSDGSHAHNVNTGSAITGGTGGGINYDSTTDSQVSHNHGGATGTATMSSASSHNTIQPVIGINFIIRF